MEAKFYLKKLDDQKELKIQPREPPASGYNVSCGLNMSGSFPKELTESQEKFRRYFQKFIGK